MPGRLAIKGELCEEKEQLVRTAHSFVNKQFCTILSVKSVSVVMNLRQKTQKRVMSRSAGLSGEMASRLLENQNKKNSVQHCTH